jgi:hypothetical protein
MTPEQQAMDFNPELQDVSRQRKLADLLMAQGLQGQPQGQMISGYYVAPSFTQQLNPLANVLAGQAVGNRADTEQAKLAETLRTVGQEEVQGILKTAQTDPKAALALASSAKTPQGRALAQSLMASVLPKKTDKLIEYDTYKAEGGKKAFSDWAKEITPEQQARLDIDRQRLGLEGARFGLEQQKLALEQGGGKLTEFQGKATNFGVQMAGSIGEMAAVEKAGFNPATTKNQTLLSMAGSKLGNMVVSPEIQRYKQGMDNFTENFIRFKSGANVPMHEIEKDLKNMMPEVGDSIDKLNQKQRARERALQGMAISAGPGAKYIMQAYQTEAPAMLNQQTSPIPQNNSTPSLWGKATVVSQ